MKNKLEELFELEYNKEILDSFEERWNKDLKKIDEIYNKLSFLNKKGIKIEKEGCVQYSQKPIYGIMPCLVLSDYLINIFPTINNYDFEVHSNEINGKHTYESFIIELCSFLKTKNNGRK